MAADPYLFQNSNPISFATDERQYSITLAVSHIFNELLSSSQFELIFTHFAHMVVQI